MKLIVKKSVGALLLVGATVIIAGCGLNRSPEERIQEALVYEQAGEYRAAEIELKNALTDNPDSGQARVILGRVLNAQNQFQSAEKELRRAIDLGVSPGEYVLPLGKALRGQGKNAEVLELMTGVEGQMADQEFDRLVMLGGAQLSVGQTEAGERSLNAAVAMRGDVAEPRVLLARSAISTGDYETWKRRIAQAIEAEPDSPGVWLEKAGVEMRLGNAAEAEQAFEKASELAEAHDDPAEAFAALIGLADLALTNDDVERTEALVARMPEEYLESLPVAFVNGRVELLKGNLDGAEAMLNKVITERPGHPGASYYLAAINLEQGEFVQAESRLAALLEADPTNVLAKRLMAITRLKLNEPEKAASDVDALVSSGYTDSYLTSVIGGELLRKGEVQRAVDYLRLSADAAPDNPAIALELALAMFAQREFSGAIEVLEAVKAEGPLEARRHAMRALAYHNMGRSDRASSAAEEALSVTDQDAAALNLVGSFYAISGNSARAREVFLIARDADEANTRSDFSLAILSYQEGDKEAARASLERVVEVEPTNARALAALAQLSFEKGASSEGLELLRRANDADPGALQPALALGRYYLAGGQAARALETTEPALSRFPDNALLLRLRATAQLSAGKPNDAISTLETLRRQSPSDQEILLQLGAAQSSAGLNSRARDTLQQAIDLDRRNVRALLMLAVVEDLLENKARADALLKEVGTLDPDNPATLVTKGDILSRRRQNNEAYAAYEAAAKLGSNRTLALKMHRAALLLGRNDADKPLLDWLEKLPADIGMRSVLAQYYLNSEDYAKAAREYRIITDESPNSAGALNNLAWVLFEQGDPQAREYAQRARDAEPENAMIADTLGWILINTGELDAGRKLIEEARQSRPDDRDIAYHLAYALTKTGQTSEARAILQRILSGGSEFANRQKSEALLAETGSN